MKIMITILAAMVITYASGVAEASAREIESTSSARMEGRQDAAAGILHVTASIKTHGKRYHALEVTTRGTDAYTMEITIGGQTFKVLATILEDTVNATDRLHPEEGRGVRFVFAGDFPVSAGGQIVTVRLPEEGVTASKEVTLPAGAATLVVEPVYRKLPRNRIFGFKGERHFSQHIESLKLSVQ